MGEFKIKKVVGKTDITYGICTMGSGGNVGFGKEVTVFFNKKEYSCKMHNTVKGRIGGFGKVYKENGIKEGDELEISYDGRGNIFFVKQDNESDNDDFGNDLLNFDFNINFNFDFNFDDFPEKTLDSEEVCTCEKQLQVEELGIEDSKSWEGLPYHGGMGAKCGDEYTVAADENNIVIKSNRKFWIINRENLTYREVNENIRGKNCANGILVKDKFYWQEPWKGLFSYSFKDGVVAQEYKTKQIEQMSAMYLVKNSVYEMPVPCMIIKKHNEYSDSVTAKLYMAGEINRTEKLSRKYVKAQDQILASDGEHRIVLGCDTNDPSSDKVVYNVATGEYTSLFDELYNTLEFSPVIMQQIKECKVFATDLKTNTMVIYDNERLAKKSFVENSLLVLQGASVRRIPNIVRPYFDASSKYCTHLANLYRDCRGHEVGMGIWYELLYRTPDGSVQELFKTYGACVPENFCMIDNHTAAVKTREWELTIVDFAKNQKYTIEM